MKKRVTKLSYSLTEINNNYMRNFKTVNTEIAIDIKLRVRAKIVIVLLLLTGKLCVSIL